MMGRDGYFRINLSSLCASTTASAVAACLPDSLLNVNGTAIQCSLLYLSVNIKGKRVRVFFTGVYDLRGKD